MYEHYKKPLVSAQIFYQRLLKSFLWSAVIIAVSLLIGILGYHFTENLNWLDSLLNASMILGGMGPVDALKTSAGKLFASFYALFSGIVFLVTMSVVIAPVLHRFLHKFHLDEKEK
ncbi:MAG: hypothetical protein ACHQHP_00760 [Bacteroidia bacterium]